MQGIGKAFFVSALIYGVLGMLLGLHMGISKNHAQMPTHAHMLVIGWLSFAVFGFFYAHFGSAASKTLARAHLWLAQVSLAGLVIGLWLYYSGQSQYEPVVALSSVAYAVSFLLFVAVAVPVMRARST
jgi:uncharacterized protein involved in response to NO